MGKYLETYRMKGLIWQEHITFIKIYAPNIGAPKFINQIFIDLKGEIDHFIVIEEIKTPFNINELIIYTANQ